MTRKPEAKPAPRTWRLTLTILQKDGNFIREWEFGERPTLVHATTTKLTLVSGKTPAGDPLEVAIPAGAIFEIERQLPPAPPPQP